MTDSNQTDDDLSMPWGNEPPSDTTEDVSLDSPVAATNEFEDEETSTYGTVEEERESLDDINADRSTSDDIDVRKLFDDPTVDMLRWHYRQNGMAATVVDKPVKDAFKHGFELQKTDTTADDRNLSDAQSWATTTYKKRQKEARIKARRDGVACLFWILDDTNAVSEEVGEVDGVEDIRVLTIDNFARGHGDPRTELRKTGVHASASKAAKHTSYDEGQLVVTKSGLVVVDDITSTNHEEFVGLMYERNPELANDAYQFIHAERLQIFVNRPYVDGNVEDYEYGHLEGDSVLTTIINALTGITKAEWALGQTLLRYTAPLHVVEIEDSVTPEDDWESHIDKINKELDNINNKSSLTLPPAHSAETMSVDGDINPEPFLDGLINDICAGAEITRSVLLGTQAGTVSGQSTDIKNYYNQVERYRDGDGTDTLRDGIERKARFEGWEMPDYQIEWGPLFRIDDAKRAEGMMTVTTAVSNAVNKYLLSHEDAREILAQQWAEFDVDADLGEMTETEMDQLDRINTTKGKQFQSGNSPEDEVEEYEGKRSGQNGGGRDGGNTTDPSDPTTQ